MSVRVAARTQQHRSSVPLTPEERRTRYQLGASIVLLPVLIGALVVLLAGGSRASGSGPGPYQSIAGLPSGFADTQLGAEVAATTMTLTDYQVENQALSASPEAIAHLYATPSFAASYTTVVQQQLAKRLAHATEAASVSLRRCVFGTRALSYTPQRATVELWESTLLYRGGEWAQVQLVGDWTLIWEGGDWHAAAAGEHEATVRSLPAGAQTALFSSATGASRCVAL